LLAHISPLISQSANALIHNIAATEQDFNKLASMFNDSTWSYENMRTYFTRIEDNLFLNESDPNHGFNGWLKSNNNPGSIFENFPGKSH
jgi:choline dehydrogenase